MSRPTSEPHLLHRCATGRQCPCFIARLSVEIKKADFPLLYSLGKPIVNFGVSKVVKSSNDKIKEGDHVYGSTPFSEYNVFDSKAASSLVTLENKEKLPWAVSRVSQSAVRCELATDELLVLPRIRRGSELQACLDRLLPTDSTSSASTPRRERRSSSRAPLELWGSECPGVFASPRQSLTASLFRMVISLSQRQGLKVIASAGTDEKVEYLRSELGVDVAFNYKTEKTRDVLSKNPFNIYWDNVGGETLEDVYATIEKEGRIISCGAIADYNTPEPYGIKNTFQTVAKELVRLASVARFAAADASR